MDFNTVLEKYGLLGVMILMLPYFVKTTSPILKDAFNFFFAYQKTQEKRLASEKVRDELRLQAELQEQARKAEHDRWMYENTFSVLKENLTWIRQQFSVVQKEEEAALADLKRELGIIGGQIEMLTKSVQRLQEVVYNINERCLVCNVLRNDIDLEDGSE